MNQHHHLRTLEQLLPSLHRPCLRWATRCCGGNSDEGADLVQELYVRLWDGRLIPPSEMMSKEQIDLGSKALRTWLFSVLRKLASNKMKMIKRHLKLLKLNADQFTLLQTTDFETNLETQLITHQEQISNQNQLKIALSKLSKRQREVIELVFDHELTIEQAAQVMGVTLGSARVHYDRAKRKLSELLSTSNESPCFYSSTPHAGDLA